MVAILSHFEPGKAALHTIDEGRAKFRDQQRFVTDRRRQSRIDSTRIISHDRR
jgi:hypothetical protein